jgi:CBS domain-containing protein
MTTVQEIMTTEPLTLTADASVVDAARVMRAEDVGDVIVVGDDGTVTGIVTDRDITVRAVADGRDPSQTPIADVCTPFPLTLAPADDVTTAVDRMRDAAVRRLPVVEDGRPVGVVALGDLAIERDPDSALADISARGPNN